MLDPETASLAPPTSRSDAGLALRELGKTFHVGHQAVEALAAAFLACGTFGGWLNVAQIFSTMAIFGVATAFESPAAAALLPGVAPEGMMQKGTAVSTAAWQVATISGPGSGNPDRSGKGA